MWGAPWLGYWEGVPTGWRCNWTDSRGQTQGSWGCHVKGKAAEPQGEGIATVVPGLGGDC